jgi:hypothetical protein
MQYRITQRMTKDLPEAQQVGEELQGPHVPPIHISRWDSQAAQLPKVATISLCFPSS